MDYMSDQGAAVVAEEDPNLFEFRAEIGIPIEARSCHTALVDGYVVEGHVPSGAVEQLLAIRPDAIGVTVPGMPPDSPGMSEDPADWVDLPVYLIERDGSLTPFDY
jgi:hypothetical protein